MNKEKLVNGLMWVSISILCIFSAAISLMKGFNSDNIIFIIIGIIMIIGLFYCGFKGISTILDAIFKK